MALISGPRYPFDFFTSVAKTEFTTQDFLVESGDKKMLDQASLKKLRPQWRLPPFWPLSAA
jgi:hypothetical protein